MSVDSLWLFMVVALQRTHLLDGSICPSASHIQPESANRVTMVNNSLLMTIPVRSLTGQAKEDEHHLNLNLSFSKTSFPKGGSQPVLGSATTSFACVMLLGGWRERDGVKQ